MPTYEPWLEAWLGKGDGEPLDGYRLEDFMKMLEGEGPLAYWWSDKPHQLVYRLVREVARLRRQ